MALLTTFAATRRARRRRALWTVLGLIVAAVTVVLGTSLGYDVGRAQRATEIDRLISDLAQAHEVARLAVERAAAVEQAQETATARAAQLQASLEALRPGPEEAMLLALVQQQLQAGIAADRLAFVLREARPQAACEKGLETRRLAIHTAAAIVPAPAQAFAGNRITITGEGAPIRRPDGSNDPAFDPSRPVTLRFLKIGREVTAAQGALPLSHAVVVEGRELRFTVRASDHAGEVEVTMQTCGFP